MSQEGLSHHSQHAAPAACQEICAIGWGVACVRWPIAMAPFGRESARKVARRTRLPRLYHAWQREGPPPYSSV